MPRRASPLIGGCTSKLNMSEDDDTAIETVTACLACLSPPVAHDLSPRLCGATRREPARPCSPAPRRTRSPAKDLGGPPSCAPKRRSALAGCRGSSSKDVPKCAGSNTGHSLMLRGASTARHVPLYSSTRPPPYWRLNGVRESRRIDRQGSWTHFGSIQAPSRGEPSMPTLPDLRSGPTLVRWPAEHVHIASGAP